MEKSLPTVKKSIFLLMGGFGLGFFVALLYSLGYLVFTPGLDIQNANLYVAMFLGEAVIPIPIIIWGIKNKHYLKDLFRLNPVNPGMWLPGIISSMGILIALDEIDRIISTLITMPESKIQGIESIMQIQGPISALFIIGVVVFLGPIVEEMVFRGFLQRVLENKLRKTIYSILISAASFAILHFNPWWLIQIYIMGIFLAYLGYYSRSIFLPFILHALNNGASVLASQFPDKEVQFYSWQGHVHPLILLIGVLAIYYGLKKIKNKSIRKSINVLGG